FGAGTEDARVVGRRTTEAARTPVQVAATMAPFTRGVGGRPGDDRLCGEDSRPGGDSRPGDQAQGDDGPRGARPGARPGGSGPRAVRGPARVDCGRGGRPGARAPRACPALAEEPPVQPP